MDPEFWLGKAIKYEQCPVQYLWLVKISLANGTTKEAKESLRIIGIRVEGFTSCMKRKTI